MSSAINKLEERIRELGRKMDELRNDNESFRRAAASGSSQQVSSQEALADIESLKQENHRLRQKLETVDKNLESVLDGIEKLGDGGKA